MATPRTSRYTPHEDRGPTGSSSEGPSGRGRMAAPRACRYTPREDRGPIGSSTEGPCGRGCMRDGAHFGEAIPRMPLLLLPTREEM
eukprot:2011824-Pyramimonas_sp.AAC.1